MMTFLVSEISFNYLAVNSYIALNMAYRYCHENDLVVKRLAFGRRQRDTSGVPDVSMKSQTKFLGITTGTACHELLEYHLRYGLVIWEGHYSRKLTFTEKSDQDNVKPRSKRDLEDIVPADIEPLLQGHDIYLYNTRHALNFHLQLYHTALFERKRGNLLMQAGNI
ncbi:hypothetical protein J6590_072604 [Homalodisca vitripennis]|nr:hypothetical protein J6590_072604 [Homalodisca vitripennis]